MLWIAALIAGLVVVFFAKLSEQALEAFASICEGRRWLPLVLTPAVGMGAAWLTIRFFPGAQGSGIPQVIAAARLARQGKRVGHLVSIRIALGKIFVGALALLGGFSVGREGPSVQVSASIVQAASRWLPHRRAIRQEDLLIAGGAAGVAAAFNTPLPGIVFAIEELGRRLEARTSGILLGTIILAGLVSLGVLGDYKYFGTMSVGRVDSGIVVPVIIAGAVCGLAGGLFSRLLQLPMRYPAMSLWALRSRHPVGFAGGCGLVVALLGLFSEGLSFGTGYGATSQVIAGTLDPPWYLPLVRFAATLASYYAGIPGGIFAPSLAVGAGIGADLAAMFGGMNTEFIALCMAAFLAAVTQSPITAAIIVMEMVDSHQLVVSLLAVSLIARAFSSRISGELYQSLACAWMGGAEKGK